MARHLFLSREKSGRKHQQKATAVSLGLCCLMAAAVSSAAISNMEASVDSVSTGGNLLASENRRTMMGELWDKIPLDESPTTGRIKRSASEATDNNFVFRCKVFKTTTLLLSFLEHSVSFTLLESIGESFNFGDNISGELEERNCSTLMQHPLVCSYTVDLNLNADFIRQTLKDRFSIPITCSASDTSEVTLSLVSIQKGRNVGITNTTVSATSVTGTRAELSSAGPFGDAARCAVPGQVIILNDFYQLNPVGRFAPEETPNVVNIDLRGGQDELHALLPMQTEEGKTVLLVAGHAFSVAGDAYDPQTADDFALTRLHLNGEVDTRFGQNGFVFNDFTKSTDRILAALDLGDGSFLVAGSGTNAAGEQTQKDSVIMRYTQDGQRVNDFGSLGQMVRDESGGDDEIRALGMFTADDGSKRIVAAGYTTNGDSGQDLSLQIFNENGQMQCEITDNDINGGDDQFHALDILQANDGIRIIAAGFATNAHGEDDSGRDAFMRAYRSDCSPDAAFTNNGTDLYDPDNNDRIWAVKALEHEGQQYILTASTSDQSDFDGEPIYQLTLSRFNNQSTLDTDFGQQGQTRIAVTAPENESVVLETLLDDDVPLLLIGKYASPSCSSDNDVLTAVSWNGTQDQRFDATFNQFGGANAAVRTISLLTLPNDEQRVMVGGFGNGGRDGEQARDFMVAAWHPSGAPDECFGLSAEELQSRIECQDYLPGMDNPTTSASPTPTSSSTPPSGGAECTDNGNEGDIAGLSVTLSLSLVGNVGLITLTSILAHKYWRLLHKH